MGFHLIVIETLALCHALLEVKRLLETERLGPLPDAVSCHEDGLTGSRAIAIQVLCCLAKFPGGFGRGTYAAFVQIPGGIPYVDLCDCDASTRPVSYQ